MGLSLRNIMIVIGPSSRDKSSYIYLIRPERIQSLRSSD